MVNTDNMTADQIRKAYRDYNRIYNEGREGYNPYAAAYKALPIKQPRQKDWWTREDTIERKQAWNDGVKDIMQRGWKMTNKEVKDHLESKLKFGMVDLQLNIKHHGV